MVHEKIKKKSARTKTVPQYKRRIGHTKSGDIYETPEGFLFEYIGTKKEDWNNPSKWRRLTRK
jgi:hypothetical protein